METKEEKFTRISDTRLPKITHALSLLENLGGPGYDSTVEQRLKLLAQLNDAVDKVAVALNIPIDRTVQFIDTPVSQALSKPFPNGESLTEPLQTADLEVSAARATPVEDAPKALSPSGDDDIMSSAIVDGGSTAMAEISWAYDSIGKDNKLARSRLKRVINFWKNR